MELVSLLDWFFFLVTQLGDELFYILFLTIVYWCIDRNLGKSLLIVLLPAIWVNIFFKDLFKMPRPPPEQQLIPVEGYGFPSGHAQGSTVLWGYIALKKKKPWLYVLAVVLISLISYSRIYLGVHYVHDIIGGLIIGALFLGGFLTLEKRLHTFVEKLNRPIKLSLILGVPLLFMLLAYFLFPGTNLTAYTAPLGALSGALFGFEFETYISLFKTDTTPVIKRCLRLLIGLPTLFGLLAIFSYFGSILAVSYLRYFVLGAFVSFVAPLIFIKLNL